MPQHPSTCLFDEPPQSAAPHAFAMDAMLLRGFARPQATALLDALAGVLQQAPPRRMLTPGGRRMSVCNTNCGAFGWVSDRRGYRYQASDPGTGLAWPAMPDAFAQLARHAAHAAGFGAFAPDACLVNIYEPGTRLSLHQDRDERDFAAPIVSVSLGLPATFLFGGATRTEPTRRLALLHGDVVVWGRRARLAFHGVAPLAAGAHPLVGARRINLTLRKAR